MLCGYLLCDLSPTEIVQIIPRTTTHVYFELRNRIIIMLSPFLMITEVLILPAISYCLHMNSDFIFLKSTAVSWTMSLHPTRNLIM